MLPDLIAGFLDATLLKFAFSSTWESDPSFHVVVFIVFNSSWAWGVDIGCSSSSLILSNHVERTRRASRTKLIGDDNIGVLEVDCSWTCLCGWVVR